MYLNNKSLDQLQKLSQILDKELIFVDLETTGLVSDPNFSIIEIGLVSITEKRIKEHSSLINPKVKIPYHITNLTGISNEMVKNSPVFDKYTSYFHKKINDIILLGFNNKAFDSKGIEKMCQKQNRYIKFNNQIDIRYLFLKHRNEMFNIKSMKGSLTDAAKLYKIYLDGNAHRAGYDIALTCLVCEKIIQLKGLEYLKDDIKKLSCNIIKDNYFKNIS